MFSRLKQAAFALPVLGIVLAAGCGAPSSHPNQINAFDGATYDNLLVARGALVYLRTVVPASYPTYTTFFNQANLAYAAAYSSYAAFRTQPSTSADVVVTIDNLTVTIVALENAFQADMHATAHDVALVRAKAKKLRASAQRAGLTISDILTELEIAATVARTISPAAPYAALAQMVIATTTAALAAQIAEAGQPIDMTQIQPVPAL